MRLPQGSVLGIAAGLGVAAVVVGAFMFGASIGGGRAAANEAGSEANSIAMAAPGPMYQMKERVLNLADEGGRRYLKIALSVEFTTGAAEFRKASAEHRKEMQAEFEKALEPQVPLIEDTIITVLAARTTAGVSTPEGKQTLKTDLKDSLNRVLGGEQVANIYFNQFVTQ